MALANYKNKVRVRVGGLLVKKEAVLLVQLKSPLTNQLVWMLPGGGLEFGESMKTALQREFKEETGLKISTEALFAVDEVRHASFHAVECYFKVHQTGGRLRLGSDPEHTKDDQIIKDVQWIPLDQLEKKKIAPKELKYWVEDLPHSDLHFYSQMIN